MCVDGGRGGGASEGLPGDYRTQETINGVIIDGKKIASEIQEEIRGEVAALKKRHGRGSGPRGCAGGRRSCIGGDTSATGQGLR